jgi:hypothetical protein
LQNDNQSTEIFTDIDQYNDYQGTNDNNQGIDGNTVVGVAILKLTLPFIRLFNAGWGLGFNGWGNLTLITDLVGIILTTEDSDGTMLLW